MTRADEIRVSLYYRKDRGEFYMQYREPGSDRKVRKRTGTASRRKAERGAANWEAELRRTWQDNAVGRIIWAEFRERYESEVLSSLAIRTDLKASGVLNVYQRMMQPMTLADVTAASLSRYANRLREAGRSESTIKGHLAHIRAALNWAVDVGLLPAAPKVPKVHRAKSTQVMKGRAITTEEFERMLAVTGAVVGEHRADSWRHLLRGLWWSGLRLGEALELHWADRSRLCVDFSCHHPLLWIPADSEKGHKDRLLPMAPEFAEFLAETPQRKRDGFVFNPCPVRERRMAGSRLGTQQVSRIIQRIGQRAAVKVSGGDDEPIKWASAHDLRRSFGDRWALRVMPQVLKELMRHEAIETTMRYYVGRSAQATAGVLWDAYRQSREMGNPVGNQTEKGLTELP